MKSILIAVMLLACGVVAEAQQQGKIPLIGYLEGGPRAAHTARMEAFRQGLREYGYEEGKNIAIEWRFADAKLERLSTLAAGLVRLNVNLIVTAASAPTRAAKEATSKIPIVMVNDNDPVANGVLASLARPGGNITGLSNFAPELSAKRLEILREVVPKLSRVAVLATSTVPGYAQLIRDIELAAKAFGLKLQLLDVLDSKDIETAFRAASKGRAEGVLALGSAIFVAQRARIIELGEQSRLPAIYNQGRFVEDGGLMYYGVNVLDLDRRAATYVDKILKGHKPADLSVEQPLKFEFIVNLQAAKKISLTIPPNVLVRATRVIK